MLKQNKVFYYREVSFFLKHFLIASILYYPLSLDILFSQQVVASVKLSSQNTHYQLVKKIEGKKTSYLIKKSNPVRSIASKQKINWKNKALQFFTNNTPSLKQSKSVAVTERQFLQYFTKIKTLIWTLKYKNPNFELAKCKKTIAQLKLNKNTYLNLCTTRPQGLAKISPLLKQLKNLKPL
ncbi:MAG: hypothetical protein HAW63_01615 [Bdellovibrionaceae bacterium]|nr:hypothetical protein [Pseudobdellovibrionaceae bacterium]